MPRVSVIMPIYNGEEYINEALNSIIAQTFEDWELIIINEFGSSPACTEIIKQYMQWEPRIRLHQNDILLGISKSINKGLELAQGEYIARMDGDDIANPQRFEKQVKYMDEHKEIGALGTDFEVRGANWKSNLVVGTENIKADLLFFVSLRHPTVMYRKSSLIKYSLKYSEIYTAAEDYDLFCRMSKVVAIDNISDKLVIYRRHPSAAVNRQLYNGAHVCRIWGARLMSELGLVLKDSDIALLYNHCLLEWNRTDYEKGIVESFERLEQLLCLIEKGNNKLHIYNRASLKQTLKKRLNRALEMSVYYADNNERQAIEQIYRKSKYGDRKWKYIAINIVKPFRKITHVLMSSTIDYLNMEIERWTWERYKRTFNDIKGLERKINVLTQINIDNCYYQNRVPYIKGERIRLVFLYQVASFWPSWDYFYFLLFKDERFDIKFLLLEETAVEKDQMNTAKEFLDHLGIPYYKYEEFDLENYKPHILVMQTPYDEYHRKPSHYSSIYKSRGYRIVYIPYGIEITDTETSRHDQYEQNVQLNAWRIYTFSNIMAQDYRKHCTNGLSVRGIGIPRLDSLYEKDKFKLSLKLKERINGRKVVLWKVHFPKITYENDKPIYITPDLEEYVKFSSEMKQFQDLFFIFMPHPKFKSSTLNNVIKIQIDKIYQNLESLNNVYIDEFDDYRTSLINSDCIIIDRSAVMVEAATLSVPILYMSNPNYFEPLNQAVKPIVSSYYQGTRCKDMINFINMYMSGNDPKKSERELKIKTYLSNFDGKCSQRIIEDIVTGINAE